MTEVRSPPVLPNGVVREQALTTSSSASAPHTTAINFLAPLTSVPIIAWCTPLGLRSEHTHREVRLSILERFEKLEKGLRARNVAGWICPAGSPRSWVGSPRQPAAIEPAQAQPEARSFLIHGALEAR
jgi:hypothetical protein